VALAPPTVVTIGLAVVLPPSNAATKAALLLRAAPLAHLAYASYAT
jgi:hypothetical protein